MSLPCWVVIELISWYFSSYTLPVWNLNCTGKDATPKLKMLAPGALCAAVRINMFLEVLRTCTMKPDGATSHALAECTRVWQSFSSSSHSAWWIPQLQLQQIHHPKIYNNATLGLGKGLQQYNVSIYNVVKNSVIVTCTFSINDICYNTHISNLYLVSCLIRNCVKL